METSQQSISQREQSPPQPAETRPHASLLLVALFRLIIHRSDVKAVRELNDHRRFLWHSGERVTVAEYVYRIAETKAPWEWSGRNQVVLDLAVDDTIDKFSNLPDARNKGQGRSCRARGNGPDCRYYFRALLRRLKRIFSSRFELMSEVEKDLAIARVFPKFARWQLARSCREFRRRECRHVSRFTFETENGKLTVLLPVAIKGAQRRQWVEKHVGRIDPSRPCERERVQEAIDRAVARRRIVSLNALEESVGQLAVFESQLPWSLEHGVSAKGLVETVALEKGTNIQRLRPSLQTLCPADVRRLVQTILMDMASDCYKPAGIGREFGLSKSCITRFAGPNWLEGGAEAVPDLFRNTAWVLARSPVFLAAADAAGVLPGVLEAIGRAGGKSS